MSVNKIKPLKKFGQNYLKDPNILRKIVEEINPQPEDNLIEIGPGKGALTEELFKRTDNLTAIEIDKRVSEELKEKFHNLNLLTEDFLKVDLNDLYKLKNRKLRIAGNIPYNLTSPIIFKMIDNNSLVSDSILMIQYEVANRIIAKPGTKEYGILSVILNYFCDVKFCFKVSANVFYPKPKVSSAVVHFYFKDLDIDEDEKRIFVKIVKAAFGKRRKTLKNSLKNSIFKDIDFTGSGIDLTLRAEKLTIPNFIKLANFARKSLT